MPLTCVYHPVYEMQVVEEPHAAELVASGLWFYHPNEAKKVREHHEEQIRWESGEGRENGKCASGTNGNRAQRKQRVCQKRTNEYGEHGRKEAQPKA